ncbi:Chaperone SurA [Aquicella siphonis]|uniref:Chaperone SurA n=1 Tax=Aquicella siphonis TaxID=254247 RepID=A0A5E4PEW5_9COXI|nr:peptidylprolyl isomerase [Aquicella siphonis]VVC75052.1 Chaperone SurA [Aquicella siphonis]
MKKTLLLTLLFVSALFCVSSEAGKNSEPLDQIVAVINDDVVTKSELNRALSIVRLQIAQGQMNSPSDSVLKKQVLDQIINKKLQMQIAKQVGINISDAEIDRVIQNVASKNNLSVDVLYQRINHDGMTTAEYRNELREQMTVQKLQQQEVGSHITVTPEEITSFMHSKLWQNNTSKEYHLEDILIPLSDSPSTDEIAAAKKHAQEVAAKINQGENFRAVAQKESSGSSALKGGDLGWRKLPEIPSAFAQYVVNMQPNEIADPIQTSNGFHIIHLAAERSAEAKNAAPDRAQVEQLLMQRKFEENVQNWLSKMRSQAFITMNGVK